MNQSPCCRTPTLPGQDLYTEHLCVRSQGQPGTHSRVGTAPKLENRSPTMALSYVQFKCCGWVSGAPLTVNA